MGLALMSVPKDIFLPPGSPDVTDDLRKNDRYLHMIHLGEREYRSLNDIRDAHSDFLNSSPKANGIDPDEAEVCSCILESPGLFGALLDGCVDDEELSVFMSQSQSPF